MSTYEVLSPDTDRYIWKGDARLLGRGGSEVECRENLAVEVVLVGLRV